MIFSGRPTTGRPKKGSHREGRDRKLCIRVDDDTIRKLEKVASYYGMTKSDLIIFSIDERFREIGANNGNKSL